MLGELGTEEDTFEGGGILVLGFPGVVGNEYLVRAIVRGGIVSWVDPTDPTRHPFLVDANIYPGNSGGPVIGVPTGMTKSGAFRLGGKPVLLGLVSKAPFEGQDVTLQIPGAPEPIKLHQDLPLGGTGVIEPAAKIRTFIESLKPPHTISPPVCNVQ